MGQLLNSICYIISIMGLLYVFYQESINNADLSKDIVFY